MQPSETVQDCGRVARRLASFEEREQRPDRTACRRAPGSKCRAVPVMDQPEQRQQPAPAAAPLVHRVGIERGILDSFA